MPEKLKQMSLLEDSHANQFQSLENKKEKMMIDSYSQKCLESLKRFNPDGLLAKMSKTLLTSQMDKSCKEYTMTWNLKVSKSKLSVLVLHRLELGTNVAEFGSLLPTPTVGCEEGGEQSSRVERTKSGGFILRKKNKPKMTFGAKLSDAMLYLEKQKLYPTPKARDYQGAEPNRIVETKTGWSKERKKSKVRYGASLNDVVEYQKPGGKLNPNFVEFLMAYPTNWTKIEPTELKHSETQSFHKSQEKSEKQSLRQKQMYRTPTAMDTGEDSFIYAAKILKGKINRNSNSRVQITLSTDVAIKFLKDNPHLINKYDKPFMVRTKLPEKIKFINYLKENTSIKELVKNTSIPKTKIEHWFRKDKCFSYPTIEDWNTIKPFLKEIKFDEELTFEVEQDWKNGKK